jgi:hypothetical protein
LVSELQYSTIFWADLNIKKMSWAKNKKRANGAGFFATKGFKNGCKKPLIKTG